MKKFAVLLGLMLAVTGCDDGGGGAGSAGSGGSGGTAGSGGMAGSGGTAGSGGSAGMGGSGGSAPVCENDTDCQDMLQCTVDGTCNTANGMCEGGSDEPTDTECDEDGGSVCDGAGNCVECNDNAQCPDDGNDCTNELCDNDNGTCLSEDADTGTSCDYLGGAGLCSGGSCFDAANCMPSDKCDDDDDCTADVCEPSDGTCTYDTEPDDTECNDAEGGLPGTCQTGVCVGLCDGIDCDVITDCTVGDTCDPADGQCTGGSFEDADTLCDTNGGSVCDGAGNCVECNDASQCSDDGNECTADPSCTSNACDAQADLPADTACDTDMFCDGAGTCVECNSDGQCGSGEVCTNNTCMVAPIDPPAMDKPITVGCTTTASTNVTVLPFLMTADPGPIVRGQAVTVDYTGLALFEKTPFLDAGLGLFPGLTRASLTALNATVQVRTGLSGPNVILHEDPSNLTVECSTIAAPCTVDSDCAGSAFGEFCGAFMDLPASWFCDNNSINIGDDSNDPGGTASGGTNTGLCNNINRLCSTDADCGGAPGTCDPNCDDACLTGGVCDTIGGVALTQCESNGYCLIGDLPLPLNKVQGNYTADATAGVDAVKIGWWDDCQSGEPPSNPGSTCDLTIEGDGTYLMPVGTAVITPVPNIAIQVIAGAAAVPIECLQAVASDGELGPTPPVPDDASPTPDSALIPFDIQ